MVGEYFPVNKFVRFLNSAFLKIFMLLLVNIAIFVVSAIFNLLYVYFVVTFVMGLISIFFLSNREEKDTYKVIVFTLMFFVPLVAIGYAYIGRQRKGSKKIKKEWSDITYRNRKSVFQSSETMNTLKSVNQEVYKTCNYLVDSIGLPCFQNASVKYYSFGESYFKDMFEECKKATNYIIFECYKIVPGKTWNEFFDILRMKAREGVLVRIIYDDAICTRYIPDEDFERMKNHGIETVPFNKYKGSNGSFVNCRNYKRLCVVDGKVGFFGGFNVDDEYINSEENPEATKDCGFKISGEAVKNLIVMFYEDYQFATKKVINLQEYFADNEPTKSKDWVLPYSTNPVALEHTNKNVILSMINNAKNNITIITSYITLDDELKNALIVNSKSGVKVRLIFSGEKTKKRTKNLARSYFYDLLKEGIEVYEYKSGKMTSKLVVVDNNSVLISTSNLDNMNTYKHFNAGVFMYGDTVLVHNDLRDIITNSQLVTIKDLQKRKFTDKISALFSKFWALFK